MRSTFHRILERYLASDQHAFEATPEEWWPETPAARRPQGGSERSGERRDGQQPGW